jgi:two-component system cell cycle sensor histidine kinase/response regulator CckA
VRKIKCIVLHIYSGNWLWIAFGGPLSVTVLVVDDDISIRTMVRRLLGARGYFVIDAVDGLDALDQIARAPAPVDLLVTDVSMPRMGGLPLATQLRLTLPELCVLFISGYAGGVMPLIQAFAPPSVFLEKPFAVDTLLASVDRLLERGEQEIPAPSSN